MTTDIFECDSLALNRFGAGHGTVRFQVTLKRGPDISHGYCSLSEGELETMARASLDILGLDHLAKSLDPAKVIERAEAPHGTTEPYPFLSPQNFNDPITAIVREMMDNFQTRIETQAQRESWRDQVYQQEWKARIMDIATRLYCTRTMILSTDGDPAQPRPVPPAVMEALYSPEQLAKIAASNYQDADEVLWHQCIDDAIALDTIVEMKLDQQERDREAANPPQLELSQASQFAAFVLILRSLARDFEQMGATHAAMRVKDKIEELERFGADQPLPIPQYFDTPHLVEMLSQAVQSFQAIYREESTPVIVQTYCQIAIDSIQGRISLDPNPLLVQIQERLAFAVRALDSIRGNQMGIEANQALASGALQIVTGKEWPAAIDIPSPIEVGLAHANKLVFLMGQLEKIFAIATSVGALQYPAERFQQIRELSDNSKWPALS